MLAQLSRYGALAAKVHAIRGKRLTREDFARMLEMKSVAEITRYLKAHPYYAAPLSGVDPGGIHRSGLENMLRAHWFSQYLTLFHYIPRGDAALMRYPVLHAEMEQIMAFMRLAVIGKSEEYRFALPRFFDRYSRIHYQALSRAKSYDDMLEAVRQTEFYPSLFRLRKENGAFPPYLFVENAMRSYYFRTVFDLIDKRVQGAARTVLRDFIGLQVDMINVTSAMRIRTYFPSMNEDAFSYLLPVTYKLGAVFLRQLLQASDADASMGLMRGSHYGKYFSQHQFDTLDDYAAEIRYDYARRHFSGIPSVHTAVLFAGLQEFELQNLIHVVECVRYAVPPAQAWRYLAGLRA